MAAEVCLLLMQSLTGDCDATIPTTTVNPLVAIAEPASRQAKTEATRVVTAIAPTAPEAEPQLGNLCAGERSRQLAVCVVPSKAQDNWTAPQPGGAPTTTAATMPATLPATVEIPRSPRPIPIPTVQAPQFSAPLDVTANLPSSARTRELQLRPTSGSQLYRQRQLALQSGRSYTRLSPDAYADQWQQINRQPTHQDWQTLLGQEARAIAGGQGHNRLEVVVGDSFGLWLPPEMLPRDRLWLNQSISGDTTAGILQRVSTFANTRATTIHLMAGANDLKNGVPEAQIVSNLQRTVRLLRQQHPQARIIVYSVLPTRRAEIANDRVRSLNARIAALTRQSQVEYRDIYDRFQDQWGHLRPDLTTDGLHLNPQGYSLWGRAILAQAL